MTVDIIRASADEAAAEERVRRDLVARVRDLLPGHVVAVYLSTAGRVAEVLVDGASALPETMDRIEAHGIPCEPYRRDPGARWHRLPQARGRQRWALIDGGGPLLALPPTVRADVATLRAGGGR